MRIPKSCLSVRTPIKEITLVSSMFYLFVIEYIYKCEKKDFISSYLVSILKGNIYAFTVLLSNRCNKMKK